MRRVLGTWIGAIGLFVATVAPWRLSTAQPQPPQPPAAAAAGGQVSDPGAAALAERLAEMGRAALRTPNVTVAHFRLAAAMMEAAAKLDPREPRYPRLWADASLQAGDSDSALRALKAYTALAPDDKSALIQLADLYTRSYQTVDGKLAYLQSVSDVKALPEEVRSHLAYLLFQAYTERAQAAQATAMLEQALALNPLSMEALRARYQRQTTDGTPYERFVTLLAILKSNPAQLEPLGAVAKQLAALGLAADSLPFFGHGITLAQRQGTQLSPGYALAYAIELTLVPPGQLTGGPQLAKQLVDAILTADPQNYDALLVRLLLQRQAGQKEDAAKTNQQVLNALMNRLAMIRQTLGDKSATTRPVESTDPVVWGSFEQDVARLKELKPAENLDPASVREAFASTLGEMAFFEIYFNNKPGEAGPLIDALRQVEPEGGTATTRLEGWAFLARGEKDQARVKLSAVKDRDPLADLGLIVMAPPDAQKQQGNAFLMAHPDNLLTLVALDALHEANVALVPDPAKAGPFEEALKSFPQNWINVIDEPQTFYVLRAEPLRVAHAYGEPIMVRVSIQNIGDQPITIGDDGVLRPDVWLDAQVRGALAPGVPSDFPAVAVERVGRELVLKPKQTVSQLVRIDQGGLGQLLGDNPTPAVQVTFDARTNPTATGVSAAGQIVNGLRFVDRRSYPLSPEGINRLGTLLQQGGPAEKIRSLDLAAQLVVVLAQQQGNTDATKTAQQLLETMKADSRDPNQPVQAWANAVVSRFAQPAERATYLSRLANDPYWVTRLIGLVSMAQVPLQDQRAMLKQAIEHDTNPLVVEVAKDLSQMIEDMVAANAKAAAATQQSSTRPTTAPTPLTPGVGAVTPSIQPPGPKPPPAPSTTAPSVTIPSDLPFAPPPQTPGK